MYLNKLTKGDICQKKTNDFACYLHLLGIKNTYFLIQSLQKV